MMPANKSTRKLNLTAGLVTISVFYTVMVCNSLCIACTMRCIHRIACAYSAQRAGLFIQSVTQENLSVLQQCHVNKKWAELPQLLFKTTQRVVGTPHPPQTPQNRTPGEPKIGQNDYNLVTRPLIKILRPLCTLQLLILPTRDPLHIKKVELYSQKRQFFTKIPDRYLKQW